MSVPLQERGDIEIHYSNGTFLIHDADHALRLRRHHRILSQPACQATPAAGPHCLDPHAAHVAHVEGLATFKRLERRRNTCVEENKRRYESKMLQLVDQEKELFIARRLEELRRHDVRPSERTMKEFDEKRMRITVACMPDPELSIYETVTLSREEIGRLISETIDPKLDAIYHDLHKRGFYLSSGMKFGCDFLAYSGDPVRYHADYAIRVVPGDAKGLLDLNRISFPEINSFQRLTHTANKTPVFATITIGDELDTCKSPVDVHYWTIGERVYLNSESRADDLKAIELSVGGGDGGGRSRRSALDSYAAIINNNKTRRTC